MTVPSSYHVYNAFPSPTDDRFKGNPAAVIVLPDSDQTGEVLDDVLDVFPPASELQATAVKINLPMTAYIVPLASPAQSPKFALRWFNIAHEAPACGHATNASVTHIFNSERWKDVPQIELLSRNGVIIARRGDEGRVTFRFPAHLGLVEQNKQEAEEIVGKFAKAITKGSLGHVERVLRSDVFTVIQFSKDDKIGFEDLQLDLQELSKQLSPRSVLLTQDLGDNEITARAISTAGFIAEDAATGSAHCALVPLHTRGKTGKQAVRSQQLSERGGLLFFEYTPGEPYVYIQGHTEDVGPREWSA
ncbi:hypothetical protein DB88DRAFT_492646 [Papiliotrema laurentii]|uniref:Uncharacterized protein n=1 Tax=Papiliotrema laurentii TaxID=5418 RepID=A0AAD9D0L6_PAPLA|nr:hypothetical protein DB88DRAFT_492646 [Papiliotrema laurentii]